MQKPYHPKTIETEGFSGKHEEPASPEDTERAGFSRSMIEGAA